MSVKKNLTSRLTRTRLLFPLLLIVLLLPALYWYTTRPKETAAWWNDSWVYRKRIPLTNSSGSTQSDFQIQITIDTTQYVTNNKLQNDCDDIRFTDTNGGELSYWIEPNTCNTTTTIAWVKVPSIPTTGADIYWYYGNPSASSKSSPTNTFIKEIDGVVGAWDLDETAGATEITDKSGNNNTGVLDCLGDSCANPTFNTGLFGNAGDFSDASEDYIRIPNSTSLRQRDQGTIAFWFKPTVTPYLDGLVTQANSARWDSSNVLFIFDQSNNLRFLLGKYSNGSGANTITNSIITSSNSITAGQWHFAVGSWRKIDTDTTELSLSLNGATPTTIQHDLIVGTDKDVVIGSWGWGQDPNYIRSYAGLIDQVRYYDKVLSNQEITDLYSATLNRQGYVTTNYPNKELVRQYNTNVSIGSLATEEIGPGPIAYWKFDEGYGQTANDSTSNNNDGTLGATTGSESSDPTWTTEDQCISGKCLRFDGSSDYVEVPDSSKIDLGTDSTRRWTISTWYRRTGTSTSANSILGKRGNDGSAVTDYTLFTENNNLYWGTGTAGDSCAWMSIPEPNVNEWHHVVGTLEATGTTTGNKKLYVDGVLASECNYNNKAEQASNPLEIGAIRGTSITSFFSGFIDELKIYPYARTEAQIKEDFNMGAAKLGQTGQAFLSEGLVGYWKFDENTGTTVSNSVGNYMNLSITYKAGVNPSGPWSNGKFGSAFLDAGYPYPDDEKASTNWTAPAQTSFTVSTWIKPISPPTTYSGFIISRWWSDCNESYQPGWALQYNPNTKKIIFKIAADSCGPDGTLTSSSSLDNDSWHHVVAVHENGKNIRLYINGVLDSSIPYTLGLNPTPPNLSFGCGANNNDCTFAGLTDETRIYNRALSADEVARLYNWAPGPENYLNMDEGSDSTLNDSSGNSRNGALNNGTWNTGKYGKGVNLDGTGDWIEIDDY